MSKYIINSPEKIDETGQVFEIRDQDYKAKLSDEIEKMDSSWGLRIKEYDFLNNYENDDYLVVAGYLQTIRNLHKKIYYIPANGGWQNGNSEIPYIHLDFVQKPACTRDKTGNIVTNDKGLNMGVKPPSFNGTHKLEFNYYWLKQYMFFLQTIFDKNEEWYTQLPPHIPKQNIEYADKSELLSLATRLEKQGLKQQSKLLKIYAEGAYDGRKIQKPELVFIEVAGKQECVTWGFYDENRHGFSIPAKKGIFNTSGFAPLFSERSNFISELYIATLKFILGHETAHVARGHWKLRIKEPKLSMQRNVMMNCELNADWTSANWLLDELLFETVSGNIYDPNLTYTKNRLVYLWSVNIFACYMALSWVYRDDRKWSKNTLTTFKNDMKATHPIYNLRLYNVLGKIKNHIYNDYINTKHEIPIKSVDDYKINEIAGEAWEKAYDMILSFESAFRISWEADERDILKKLKDGLIVEQRSMPDSKENIPFLLAYMDEAQREFAQYEVLWPYIRMKLKKYGAAFVS